MQPGGASGAVSSSADPLTLLAEAALSGGVTAARVRSTVRSAVREAAGHGAICGGSCSRLSHILFLQGRCLRGMIESIRASEKRAQKTNGR